MKILVVDDEPEYRLVLKNVLMSEGYTVFVAENGEDGFAKLMKDPVDLVISDIYMPVLDGIRFHRKVRATPELATVPFLFVSAFDDQHTLDAVQNPRMEAPQAASGWHALPPQRPVPAFALSGLCSHQDLYHH